MERRDHVLRERRRDRPAVGLGDAHVTTEERVGGGRAEADEGARANRRQLRQEPWAAGTQVRRRRLLVDAPFPARLPVEVLHHVRDVYAGPVEAGGLESLVEQASGGSHEGPAGEVLLVTGLLAN